MTTHRRAAAATTRLMKPLPTHETHRWLEPGPITLVTTADRGVCNVMTMGFHMMVQHDPAMIACVIGPWDRSFRTLRKTRECVIAIPPVALAKTVVDIGNCSGAEVDKFQTFGLTPLPARTVAAPLLADCLANIECRIDDSRLVNRHHLFVLKVSALWCARNPKGRRTLHHNGNGTFTVDGRTIDLRARMTKWPELVE